MKKNVVGMLALTAMATAMSGAFAQDAKGPELTAAEREQAAALDALGAKEEKR